MRPVLVLALVAAFAFPQDPEPKQPELHKIYVPYKKLEELLGTDKERVMVPYKEFLELWKLKYGRKPGTEKPPVPFTVESASYEGRVKEGIAQFKVAIEIEVFEETWQRIPLDFRGVAFEEVLVDGEPGVIAPTKRGYELILRGKGRHKVDARFVAGIAKGKEYATTTFHLPSVPLHKLTFRVPGKGTEIKIEPARAHTTVNEGDETVVLAFLGPQQSVKLTWRYQPEEADTEPPLIFATTYLDVTVQERVLTGVVQFNLDILRTPATEFVIAVPQEIQVLEVVGSQIKTWGFPDEARRQLRVVLHKPFSGRYSLRVGFEGPAEVPGMLAAPVFKVEAASRERGFIRIRSAEGVGLRPISLENVFQADLNTLPKQIRGGTNALGFRFPALPYALSLRTERIAPLVSLRTVARVIADRHTVKLDTRLYFTVERAGIFSLRMEVPKGIVLTQIGDSKLVDSSRESEEDGKRILTIALRGRRIGKFLLPIQGIAKLDLKAGALSVPFIKVAGVDREQGTLGVFLHQSLKATATTEGVVPVEPAQHRKADNFRSEHPLAFAWRWRGAKAKIDFKVELRKPKVTCDVRYTLQATESRVDVRADLVYTVQYTGVEQFRFRIPKKLVDKIKKVDANNLREAPHADDPPEEGEEDKEPTVTYTVSLQSPALGQVTITVEYADVFPEPLKVNQSRPTLIPAILPVGVERSKTHVAIRKSPAIKVEAGTADYEQIDTSELPPALRSDDVFLALRRYDEPAPFLLGTTKHEYQPVADVVIRHVHLKTVIKDDSTATTNAFFEILNNDRQFLAVKLPKHSKVLELRVENQPKKPRIGSGGALLIPLATGLKKNATFQVSLAYVHSIETDSGLVSETKLVGPVLPEYEDAPAPFQALLTWSVYYPGGWRITGFSGNVEPVGDAAERGSWLRRAIDGLGRTFKPARRKTRKQDSIKMPLAYFKDITPMPVGERVHTVFLNGIGDGTLVIAHTSMGVQVVFVLVGIALGIALVAVLAKRFKPLLGGGAVAFLALLLLAMAGPGWVPFLNGLFLAAAAMTVTRMVVEIRTVRA